MFLDINACSNGYTNFDAICYCLKLSNVPTSYSPTGLAMGDGSDSPHGDDGGAALAGRAALRAGRAWNCLTLPDPRQYCVHIPSRSRRL